MMLTSSLLVGVLVGQSKVVGRQDVPLSPRAQEMAKLDMIVGDWWGEGWQANGDEIVKFKSHETVEKKANGVIFTITGKHWVENGFERKVIYDAFGTISFDQGKYELVNNFSNGAIQRFDLRLEPNGFRWTVVEGVELELLIVNGKWVEKGFDSRSGTRRQIFEIVMEKIDWAKKKAAGGKGKGQGGSGKKGGG